MLRRTTRVLGFEDWPWPARLPFKHGWWGHASATGSIARESRTVQLIGDGAVVLVALWSIFRAIELYDSNAYQHQRSHLSQHPPAIIAQEFDFADPAKNRHVTAKELDAFREEAKAARRSGAPVETVVFKY